MALTFTTTIYKTLGPHKSRGFQGSCRFISMEPEGTNHRALLDCCASLTRRFWTHSIASSVEAVPWNFAKNVNILEAFDLEKMQGKKVETPTRLQTKWRMDMQTFHRIHAFTKADMTRQHRNRQDLPQRSNTTSKSTSLHQWHLRIGSCIGP